MIMHVPPEHRRTDAEIAGAVAKGWTPNWAHMALGFRLDELEAAHLEFDRQCAIHHEADVLGRARFDKVR